MKYLAQQICIFALSAVSLVGWVLLVGLVLSMARALVA